MHWENSRSRLPDSTGLQYYADFLWSAASGCPPVQSMASLTPKCRRRNNWGAAILALLIGARRGAPEPALRSLWGAIRASYGKRFHRQFPLTVIVISLYIHAGHDR